VREHQVQVRSGLDHLVVRLCSNDSAKPQDRSRSTPRLWNDTLLTISQNPNLQYISLSPDKELVGSHLFLMEAKKHDRLMELIKAGTPVMRNRSQSSSSPTSPVLTGTPPSPSPGPRILGSLIRFSLYFAFRVWSGIHPFVVHRYSTVSLRTWVELRYH
jgi:hypothetical protein